MASGMRTLLFAPCYLEGVDLTGSDRMERNRKWLKYYTPLQYKLGFEEIYLVDNASTPSKFFKLMDEFPLLNVDYCAKHLPRLTEHAYGYWYRAFARAIKYAIDNKYEKIIHLDTDVYVLNDRICDYIRNKDYGWISFWSHIHNYPDATMQIINADSFHTAYKFMTEDFLEFYPYKLVEDRIPFTTVEHKFIGDRYGDHDNREQTPEMDYYGQCRVDRELVFV